jgi:hypothetical protein
MSRPYDDDFGDSDPEEFVQRVRDEDDGVLFEQKVRVVGETELAIKVAWGAMLMKSEWIPKSQVHDDSEVQKKGDEGDLRVYSWFAERADWYEER